MHQAFLSVQKISVRGGIFIKRAFDDKFLGGKCLRKEYDRREIGSLIAPHSIFSGDFSIVGGEAGIWNLHSVHSHLLRCENTCEDNLHVTFRGDSTIISLTRSNGEPQRRCIRNLGDLSGGIFSAIGLCGAIVLIDRGSVFAIARSHKKFQRVVLLLK